MSIIVDKLTKRYDKQLAVNDISFKINKGEIVGFLGPNGAGKSTTMKILTGYISASSGSATVNGIDVSNDIISAKKIIGYLPENNPLYTEMYVKEYLGYVARIYGIKKNTNKAVDNVIEMTGLGIESHKKIEALSKGYKQRVGLAQALIHNPDILILDEPTTGLDPNQIVEIRDLITHIGSEKTVLLSTHIMQEVEAICGRTIIINRGKIVADGNTSRLIDLKNSTQQVYAEFESNLNDKLLSDIESFAEVTDKGDKWVTLKSVVQQDIRKDIFNTAVKNGTILLTLKEETTNLEDIFRDLTQ
jgi:ABC-2 type transport system ATP-binding protein